MDDPKQKAIIYSTCDYCGRWFRMRRWRVHLGAVVLSKQGMNYLAFCGCDLNVAKVVGYRDDRGDSKQDE